MRSPKSSLLLLLHEGTKAASAAGARSGEGERRGRATHEIQLARRPRPRSGHCAVSLPSTPGSLFHPGMLSAVGGPHSLQQERQGQRSLCREKRE